MQPKEAPVIKWPDQPKLKPEFKAKWLEALRSGKYNQCQGRLHKHGGFCCIGVAEEIMFPITGNSWGNEFVEDGFSYPVIEKTSTVTSTTSASNSLREVANLWGPNGKIHENIQDEVKKFVKHKLAYKGILVNDSMIDSRYSLAGYNDIGVPFSIIADLIEEFF